MLMSFSQQKRPRSGDQRRMKGLAGLLTRKHTAIGPNVAPVLKSWRAPPVSPAVAATEPAMRPCRHKHRLTTADPSAHAHAIFRLYSISHHTPLTVYSSPQ